MSPLIGETLGQIVTVIGWDGTHFYPLAVDADGQLQIDVLTAPLPAGAATAAHQVTMITALQLIDDLRAALATVATDSLRATVLSSALPTGAATQATLAALLALFTGTQLGYKAQLSDLVTFTCTAGGVNSLNSTVVPANEVYHVTMIAYTVVSATMTRVRLDHATGAAHVYFLDDLAPLTAVLVPLDHELWLDAGSRVRLYVNDTAIGDVLLLRLFGEILRV